MKKSLCVTLAATLLLVLLSVGLVSAQDQIHLVYWSMWNPTEGQALVLQDAIKQYETDHPNIVIDAVWNGRQNQTLVRTALSAGTVIDLIDQDADQIAGGLVREGQGLPLNDLLKQDALDHTGPISDVFLPGTLNMFDVNNTTYLFPYIYNTVQFFYDKRVFTEAGVDIPKTFDDLLAMCPKLKDAGYAPIAAEGDSYDNFYLTELVERTKGPGFLRQAAADPTGELWKDPAILDAATKTRQLWDSGCIPAETTGYAWPQGQNTLAYGQSGMELVGSWIPIELSSATDPAFDWGAFSFPNLDGGAGKSTDIYALLLSFMINKDTKHPQEAFDFLRTIMTDKMQQEFTDKALVGVTNKNITWSPKIADAQKAAAAATTTYGDEDGISALYSEYANSVLNLNWRDLWLNKDTPQQFVDKMVSQSKDYWAAHPQATPAS